MKKSIATVALVSLLAAPGALFAADRGKNTGRLEEPSRLMDREVTNRQGEKLGEINRLLMDAESGRIRFAVIGIDKSWNWQNTGV